MLARLRGFLRRSVGHSPQRDAETLSKLIVGELGHDSGSLMDLLSTLAGPTNPLPEFPAHYVDVGSLTSEQLRDSADRIMSLRFEFAAEPEVQFDGVVDWTFDPTSDPRRRWCRELHRHRWVATLSAAYETTGNENYAQQLVQLWTDWILANPPPSRKNEDDVVWTLMGVGMRAAIWPAAFFRVVNSPSCDHKVQTLILSSIHEHGEFLYNFKTHANHLLRETNGLLALAGYFPFFVAAPEWKSRALARLSEELEKQVYPDGTHQEMSSGYQWVVVEELEAADLLLTNFGWSLSGIELRHVISKMYHVLVHTVRPDGSWPQLGDGFFEEPEQLRQRMLRAGQHLQNSDLVFVATQGDSGTTPLAGSIHFPDGAFVVMRSNWSDKADWLLFRGGPFGGAHGHEDQLSIEVCARGVSLLIDPGTYTYNAGDPFRSYFVSSNAHNTVLVDGMSQVRRWDSNHRAPVGHTGEEVRFKNGSRYDYAAGVYDQGYAPYRFVVPSKPKIAAGIHHLREVFWIDQTYWLIVDRMNAKSRHSYTRVFQSSPGTKVYDLGSGVALEAQKQNASLLLLNPIEKPISIEQAIGETPSRSIGGGWASNGFRGHKTPAPRINLHQVSEGAESMFTLLVPGDRFDAGDVPVFHLSPLRNGSGTALTIEFEDVFDTLIVSTNTARKSFGEFETSGYHAAWRTREGGDQHRLLFEISDSGFAEAFYDWH